MEYSNEFKTLIYGIFLYLNIDIEVVEILAILMTIDTLFGAVKVLRIKVEKFSFKMLMLGFTMKVVFILIPLVVALIGKGLGYDWKSLVDISLKILIISEGISIFGNAIAIKTKADVKDFDIITRFLKGVRNSFMVIASGLVDGVRDNYKDYDKKDKV